MVNKKIIFIAMSRHITDPNNYLTNKKARNLPAIVSSLPICKCADKSNISTMNTIYLVFLISTLNLK